jgi:acyl-CoA reductase-like NAD-dependent aldehyde dehydrogenase
MVQGVNIEGGYILNNNPATGAPIDPPVKVTSPSEISDAITKANVAQGGWGDIPLTERIALLRKGIDEGVTPIAKELAEMITREMGKISAEAKVEVDNALALKGLWLDLIQEANEDVKLSDGEAESVIVRDALGVVVVIAPWNVSTSIHSGVYSYPSFYIYSEQTFAQPFCSLYL